MALAYLLSPTFQIENSAGKPATGGYIEVYQAGSRTKYYCASDFDGTLLPFRIPLDSLGSNVVLAEDGGAYDVYVYNRYGGLMMSRYNVRAGSGGGIGSLVSTDDSIIITTTDTGATDIRANATPPSILRATAQDLSTDGQFVFSEVERDGQNAVVDNSGRIIVNEGWWHYDAIARIRWPGNPELNETQSISIYTRNNVSDSMTFDLSYAHSETVQVSGEYKATENGTQLVVGITGMAPGMTVELVDFGVHSIIGEGAGGKYNAGEGIVIDEPNRVISIDPDVVQEKLTAGDGITIDSEDDTIAVDFDTVQGKLTAGSNIVIDTQTNTISATAEPQQQADWTESDTTSVTYIQHKPDLSVYATQTDLTNGLATKQDVISDLATIRAGAAAGATAVQDANYVHTDENFTDAEKTKLSGIAAGAEVNVQSNWTEADSSSDAYIQNKPAETTLTAGSNITITESGSTLTIAATAAPQQQANWTEADNTSVQYIQNKPANLVQDASYVHTDNNFTNSDVSKLAGIAAGAEVNVQSDWTEADNTVDSYIQHKPTEKSLVAGSNITLTEAADSVTIAATVPAQQQANWTEADNTSVSYIQNKPNLAAVATSGAYSDLSGTPDLSLKEDVANKAQSVSVNSQTDYPSSYAVANFVNSSVSTNTAKFLGNFTLTDLSLTYPATDAQIQTALDSYTFTPAPTNNDYVYVEISDPLTPGVTDIVKRFKFDGSNWLYEYALNNSSFTAGEIAAIDSGITATKVSNYDTHIADTTIHVTSTDKTTWNGKQDAISDLNTIRTGAGLGATAVQPGDLATVATSGLYSDLSGTPSLATVATSGDYDDLLNKPTIPAAQVQSDWTEADNTAVTYIQNKPSLATVATSGLYSDLSGTPSLATVATSGDYDDLLNKPSIPAAQVQSDWTEADNTDPSYIQNKPTLATVATSGLYSDLIGTPSLATVAISGDYDDLLNKPTIPAAQVQSDWTEADNTDPSYIQNKPTLATVATSGLYSDLSGTPSLATVATSGDYDDLLNKPTIPAAQVQSDWTEADNTDPSYIQNKPSLATVATSGLYSDLSGTPSLATVATSGDYDDLLNKPSIPAAQVQSNWTEADNTDPSYIQNKPTLATVATSGLYSDLSGTPTINNVPAVTSSDDSKVLKASYTGGVGSYSWEQESGGTVTDVEVDGTSVVSGGVASITMPTELVPTVTSNDDGKVLKATYTGGAGSYSWEAESGGTVTDVEVNGTSVVSGGVADITIPAQVQADWSEADTTAVSYIENKPVPKTLVAGTGIMITETANDLTVAATAASYTAGTGISISAQNVITNTGVAINKTTPELCGSFMGEPVYTKLYEFTGTVGTSDTIVNFTIDEVVATGSTVTRIWLDPSNSFIEYGSASVKLPLTYFLSSARHGSVFVVSQGAGTLSFRGVDTSSVGLTFFLAVKYTDSTP